MKAKYFDPISYCVNQTPILSYLLRTSYHLLLYPSNCISHLILRLIIRPCFSLNLDFLVVKRVNTIPTKQGGAREDRSHPFGNRETRILFLLSYDPPLLLSRFSSPLLSPPSLVFSFHLPYLLYHNIAL